MTKTHVLFVQGGGKGAYDEDATLAESLERALDCDGNTYQLVANFQNIDMLSPGCKIQSEFALYCKVLYNSCKIAKL